jgi:hypothetical protein
MRVFYVPFETRSACAISMICASKNETEPNYEDVKLVMVPLSLWING